MRALVAYDGSAGADLAVLLAASIRWQPGSVVRVVGVVEPTLALETPPAAPGPVMPIPAVEDELERHLSARIDDGVRRIAGPERTVEGGVLHGRPATTIVEDAKAFGADLLVIGSRGHGRLESLVTGSVSSEVVDAAPCPVLVAKVPSMTRVVVGWDGSEAALAAESVLANSPIFEGIPIRLVAVVDRRHPVGDDAGPTMDVGTAEARARVAAATASTASEATPVAAAAARLRAAGREVETAVRRGNAAHEIIATAEESNADVVVVGTRGRTGLARLVLGSVARDVLHRSPVSVIVVHPPRPAGKRR